LNEDNNPVDDTAGGNQSGSAPNAPPITLARPGYLNIFLSYKEVDAKAAIEIGKRLENNAPGKVDVFVAAAPKKNPPGGKWRQRIGARLESADVLILLYSQPQQDWGWCFYEGGYFDGVKSAVANRTDLIVLHGPDVKPLVKLGPLVDWNPIEINPIDELKLADGSNPTPRTGETGVQTLLRRLYVETDIRRGMLEEDEDAVKTTARLIAVPFNTQRGVIPPIDYIHTITIGIPRSPEGSGLSATPPEIPDDASVTGSPGALAMFGLLPRPDGKLWRWGELRDVLKGTAASAATGGIDSRSVWLGTLPLTMQRAVKSLVFRAGLPLIRSSADGRFYRPALTTFEQTSTEQQFTIAFVDLPDELELDPTVQIGSRADPRVITLSHLLTMCRIFRWGIILKFEQRLNEEADTQKVFGELCVAISNLYADSQSRGLNRDAVLAIFDEAPIGAVPEQWKELTARLDEWVAARGRQLTERAAVEYILDGWEQDTKPLVACSADRERTKQLLAGMRSLNRYFYELCARRLYELVRALGH
jgi:hypothetical protein